MRGPSRSFSHRLPIRNSPTPTAKLATRRARPRRRATMVLSTIVDDFAEDVAAAAKKAAGSALRASPTRITRDLVRSAEKAGYQALVVTVDTPARAALSRNAGEVQLRPAWSGQNFRGRAVATGAQRATEATYQRQARCRKRTWKTTTAALDHEACRHPQGHPKSRRRRARGPIPARGGNSSESRRAEKLDYRSATLEPLHGVVAKKPRTKSPSSSTAAFRRGTAPISRRYSAGRNAGLLGRPMLRDSPSTGARAWRLPHLNIPAARTRGRDGPSADGPTRVIDARRSGR